MGQKMLKIFCSLIMLMTVFFNVQTPVLKVAADTEGDTTVGYAEPPFKAQLDSHATIFYNALESLYKDGKMKTGVGSYDLSTSFDQNTLNKYANGESALAKAFIAARDAFVMDFPEIFYVDFSKVTLRLGMKNGTYVLYVNNGSNENYYTSSFDSQEAVEAAIVEVNAKKEEMKAGMSTATSKNPASIISYIHNKLIDTAEYT